MFDLNKLVENNPLREDPTESKIWAISPINGDLEKLEKIITAIETSHLLAENDVIVFLGNFLGDSIMNKEVADTLFAYQALREDQVIILRGSVEQRFLNSKKSFYETEEGKMLLESYRVTKNSSMPFVVAANEIVLDVDTLVSTRQWINELPCYYVSEKYFFAHSGVNGKKPLYKQEPQSLMFIKEETFLEGKAVYDRMVVHTHQSNKLLKKNNRIALGTQLDTPVVIFNDTKDNAKPEVLDLKIA